MIIWQKNILAKKKIFFFLISIYNILILKYTILQLLFHASFILNFLMQTTVTEPIINRDTKQISSKLCSQLIRSLIWTRRGSMMWYMAPMHPLIFTTSAVYCPISKAIPRIAMHANAEIAIDFVSNHFLSSLLVPHSLNRSLTSSLK